MGRKTTDAMIHSQHDCMVVRVCQKANVEAQQNVQFVSDGRWVRMFQTGFWDVSECCEHRSEEDIENE